MINRTAIALIVLVLGAVTAPWAVAQSDPADGASSATIELEASLQEWLAEHPVIRVAPDPDFAPIEFIDEEGEHGGMAADFLELIEAKLGIRFEIIELENWNEVLDQARRRDVDMLSCAAESPQRSEYLAFTAPHIRLPGVLVAEDTEELVLEDLIGKRVAVVSGYVWEELLRTEHPEIKLVVVPDIGAGLRATATGAADAMIGDPVTTAHFLEQEQITTLRIAGMSGYSFRLALAVRADWPELVRILDKALADISVQEREAIEQKWYQLEGGDDESMTLLVTVALSLLVSIGSLVAFLLWNRALRRRLAADLGEAAPLIDVSRDRRKILFCSIGTMAVIAVAIGATADFFLYRVAFEQQRVGLMETATAQARLIEAVARFDRIHSEDAVAGGAAAATVSQIIDAHEHQQGIGRTGEFTLGRRQGDEIVFLLERRHATDGDTHRIAFVGSETAEPMRRALSGRAGTMVGRDYREETVLAAYVPVGELGLGIVAKIDLAEIRQPFERAALVILALGALLVLGGALFMVWVNNPLMKRIEDRERRLDVLVSSVPDGIITIDERGVVGSFNAAAERMFGYTTEEIIGRNIRMLMPEKDAAEHDAHLARYCRTGERHIIGSVRELEGKRSDGTVFAMELAVNEMRIEGARMFVGIARDVTERARFQAAIMDAREAAEAANRAKSAFLANMSHELRTPMNAIIGYSEMLVEEAEDLGQGDFIPDLNKINQAGKHLLALINDILDLSKIESGKMELYLETFDVGAMLDDVGSTVLSLVAKNNNRFQEQRGEGLGAIHADLTKMRQVLFNLISNAAKFTKDGTITLAAERGIENGADRIVISVTDTGIGITADAISALFEEFTQADASTTRQFGGTGLGLAITRRFCRMMGGEVTVRSVLGEGSTFSVDLPAIVAETAAVEAGVSPSPARPSSAAPTILVIDDDPNARELLERSLRRDGFEVVTARNGEEGLQKARDLRPRAITLDVMMPGSDGWTILRALKDDPEVRDIPVIMVTMVDDRNMGFALGAAEYLTKPVNRDRLSQVVSRFRCANPPCPVLIVDDDEQVRDVMRRTLEKEGWVVTEAANGREGLDRLQENTPTLVILDLMMPVMDGFEFVHEMRNVDAWRTIPVIVVTAKDLTDEDRHRLRGDVAKIIEKGAHSRDEMLEEVRGLISDCVPQRGPDR